MLLNHLWNSCFTAFKHLITIMQYYIVTYNIGYTTLEMAIKQNYSMNIKIKLTSILYSLNLSNRMG